MDTTILYMNAIAQLLEETIATYDIETNYVAFHQMFSRILSNREKVQNPSKIQDIVANKVLNFYDYISKRIKKSEKLSESEKDMEIINLNKALVRIQSCDYSHFFKSIITITLTDYMDSKF